MSMGKGLSRRLLLVMLAAFCLSLLLAVPAMAAPPTGDPITLVGTTEGKYYKGVKEVSATVYVAGAFGDTAHILATQTSTESGLFVIVQGYPLAQYYLPTLWCWMVKDGFIPATTTNGGAAQFDNSPGTGQNVDLQLTVMNTTVKGKVVAKKGHKPLKNVKVKIGNRSWGTSGKGTYTATIGLWPSTTYKATFSKKGYKTVKVKFTSSPGHTVTLKTVKLRRK